MACWQAGRCCRGCLMVTRLHLRTCKISSVAVAALELLAHQHAISSQMAGNPHQVTK